jgi:hypothetical protein
MTLPFGLSWRAFARSFVAMHPFAAGFVSGATCLLLLIGIHR